MSLRSALLAAALVLSPACSSDRTSDVWSVPVDDGGYALVRVDVPDHHDLRVRVTIDDAEPGETYYLLFRRDRAPRSVGWFDVAPVASRAASCGDDDDDDDGCDPLGAGRFVALGTAVAGGKLELDHDGPRCWAAKDWCAYHYAILAGARLASDRRATLTVTTKDVGDASPARIQILH